MDVWSIIGWGGSALVVWSLLQTRILRLRILNLIGCVILVGFNAVVGVWPMVGMNAVLAIINVVHLWRLLRHRHDEAEYQVLPVNAADAYLGYILERHQKDITRFNPGFTLPTSPYAFLVQHGDRTVGVVLAHDAGAGRAQIDLDYVVPKYRDFTPGEFVYRRSDVFTDQGFHQVIAPPRMRDSTPYLKTLGFRREGEDLVLNL
ncbi:inner membrane protein [Kribbella sp. VKM Ac-2571]|uniref:YgjV family protein n=1 Tax=Kribbella sp. VKM Ac-2571 TaxID=2512222 RepID=UPI001061D72F|nr:YgjV family protein [Kribbella sp. VKM Ac-2571]TDO67383.1 inner membrane protein [Kribbella sp. VKM Ac-2571]